MVLALVAVAGGVSLFINAETITFRVGIITPPDMFFGVVTTLLVPELSRRLLGVVLPAIAVIFLIYGMYGPYFPGVISHRGYSFDRIVTHTFLGTQGLFGGALDVSATFIVLFVIFSSMLEVSGGGQLIVDMAKSAFERSRGGPAKAAVVGSALVGTISGSAVVNVVTSGTVTIPLMKKTGYSPEYAAAVESTASTGGQLMPPVMGSTAFLIADILGISYFDVCVAAALPAILYYTSLFMCVHFAAVRDNLGGVAEEGISLRKAMADGGHLLIPLGILVYFLGVMDYSVTTSAFWATISGPVIAQLRKSTRFGWRKLVLAMRKAAMGMLQVALSCACAGIIVGIFNLTGLGLKLSTILVDLSGKNLFVLGLLTMIASLILGTGLPTVPTYLLLAIFVAPAMIKLGMWPLAAHMFVFCYGILAAIRPPTMITVYTAAGLAETKDIGRTTYLAMRLSLVLWMLPFMFQYAPAFLMHGTLLEIAEVAITGTLSVTALAAGLEGCYFFRRPSGWERPLFLAAAVLLGGPEQATDLVGAAILGALTLRQYLEDRASRSARMAN